MSTPVPVHPLTYLSSPFANLYLALANKIQETLNNAGYAGVLVSYDFGQLETREMPSISKTCTVLIGFDNFSFKDEQLNVQHTEGKICIKLAVPTYGNIAALTPYDSLINTLKIFDIELLLYRALQGYMPAWLISVPVYETNPTPPPEEIITSYNTVDLLEDISGTLTRTRITSDLRRDGLFIREMEYAFAFDDYSAKQTNQTITFTPDFTFQIINNG